MSKSKPQSAPAFLRGIYFRDDFDLNKIGSAFASASEPDEPEPEPTETPIRDTASMDDDEFLMSLLTTSDDQAESESATWKQDFFGEAEQPDEAVSSRLGESCHKDRLGESGNKARNERYPFSLNWLSEDFNLEFTSPVTFLVGENGSGKSTLIEAIASLCGYPVSGGGTNDATTRFGPEQESELARALYPNFKKRHRDGYFFRAEFYAHFASLLEERARDPDFAGDPYMRYGGKSLHNRSHGESFLALLQNRFNSGLYLMDEPESALSPQRQLTLLAMIADRVSKNKSQFIIATHSPILMTFPGAMIISFDGEQLKAIKLEETNHFILTRDILSSPEMYWKHLWPKDVE